MRLYDIHEWRRGEARSLPLDAPVEILRIDPEDEWELADGVDMAFRAAGVTLAWSKDAIIVAKVGDDVIGGIRGKWYTETIGGHPDGYDDDPDNDEYWVFDFDIAVAPDWQGHGNVGMKLIQAALDEYRSMDVPLKMISCLVVNDRLGRMLERKFGFNPTDDRYPMVMTYH